MLLETLLIEGIIVDEIFEDIGSGYGSMLKGFKTEIETNENHRLTTQQSIGVCRYLYNSYLAKNQELYQQFKDGLIDRQHAFMSANDFDKYINNEIKTQEEFEWINSCGSKARKKSIVNAETAFKKFFKGEGEFPRFKKKKNQDVKIYFPKNNKGDWTVQRHRIKVPTLGWCKLKEKGYIRAGVIVKSGTVSFKAGRYYVSVLADVAEKVNRDKYTEGIGIDLGIKDLAIVSNIDKPFKNINKSIKIKKLEKKLKRKQGQISRKYEMNKQGKKFIKIKNIIKLENQTSSLNVKLTNIRQNYIHNITSQLTYKSLWSQVELRMVDRWYPSSKTCNYCKYIKKDLKLSDREFICPECGVTENRDKNASYNLRDAKIYKVII